jgi:hypothetical protein
MVKGITGESFVPSSLILPEGISVLCDDVGLRTMNLATLPTLDESGVAVRQTGGRDPHRGIRISDASAGCPQTVGVAPSAPARASRASITDPRPLDKGKGAARSSSVPSGAGVSEEERRHRLHRADGSFVSDPPPPPPRWGRGGWLPEASEDCWWGQGDRLPGPGRVEARQSATTATIGSAATTTTTAIGPGSQVSGAPFFFISLFTMSIGLNPSFACQGFAPTPKVVPPPPPAAVVETAPLGPQAPAGGPAAAAPTPSGAAAAEGVPTAPTAATASTTAMPSSTLSAAIEEAPAAPAASIEVDAGCNTSGVTMARAHLGTKDCDHMW